MRRYLIFFTVSLALMLAAINNSSASVAFPVMVKELDAPLILVGWVLTAYQLVQTIGMAIAGKISDVIGSRKAFIIYTLLFLAGSILCGLAPNVYLLIGARVIQALGGGGFMPCAAGIVSETFPENRQRAIGLFSSIFPIGAIIGPNLGGWVVESFGWRYIFWYNIPLILAILILSRLLLPARVGKGKFSDIDLKGAALLFGALGAIMLSLTEIGHNTQHIQWLYVGLLLALSLICFIFFVIWERRVKAPIIDFELIKERPFMAANIYNTVYGICALGIFSLIPLYAVSVYGMSSLASGVLLTPRSIGMMLASTITAFSLVKWGYRKPILLGTITVAIGLTLLALEPRGFNVFGLGIGTVPLLYILLGICGIGHGVCTPAANNACIELMPDKVATITGLRGMFRNIGSTFGVAVATLVLSAIPDTQLAFKVIFFAAVGLMLVSIPTIFMMPDLMKKPGNQNQPAPALVAR